MTEKIDFLKGLKASLPTSGATPGALYFCTDTGELYLVNTSGVPELLANKGIAAFSSSGSGNAITNLTYNNETQTLTAQRNNFLPLSGGTIISTSDNTALYLQSASTVSYLGFKNNQGNLLGQFGVNANNQPVFRVNADNMLLHSGNYTDYVPTKTGSGASGDWTINITGNAAIANTVKITRAVKNILTLAAETALDSEVIYFAGSDGVAQGFPTSYCIANIKKGNNHRTLIDCYHLETGNHYINGCKDTRDPTTYPWTGWVLQPTQATVNTHINDNVIHITATERANWNAAKAYADETHAPVDAEKNQNAFSNITIGSTTLSADNTTDTIELVAGTNITLTPDSANDKITITATSNDGTITEIQVNGTSIATNGIANIPAATTNKYGVTKLSSSTNSTSTSLAATSSAVKAAYDLANSKAPGYTYGTTDLIAGVSELTTGTLYFVYE